MFDSAMNFLNGFRCIVMAAYYWLILINGASVQPWKDWFFQNLNGTDWFADRGWLN